jgi:hypothetical protein
MMARKNMSHRKKGKEKEGATEDLAVCLLRRKEGKHQER